MLIALQNVMEYEDWFFSWTSLQVPIIIWLSSEVLGDILITAVLVTYL